MTPKKPLSEIQEMILDGVSPIRHIAQPEADLMRKSEVAAVRAGKPDNQCPHPVSAIEQYVDKVPGRVDRPTNLYQCTICHDTLWLVNPHGRAASDG